MKKAYLPLLFTGLAILAVILQFGFLFLLLAMMPSIMAYFSDHLPGKALFKTMLACNFAATLPALMPMLEAGLQFEYFNVSSTMTNPRVWLMAYGGAAAGWCLVYLCRFIARFLLILLYEYRASSLERFQKKLVDEWSEEVTGQKVPPQPR